MAKTALIVDDSASARLVLKRILAAQQLAVDTAASGEEALAYLRHGRPDVIFMDHMMPGMDGFEALEAIKQNPQTATIPVMMYTAQEGELYVGQARALGAFGVLPKQVEPVEIVKVLRALHLIPATTQDAATETTAPQTVAAAEDSQRVRALLADLFDQQRVELQREIRRGYERLAEHKAQAAPVSPGEVSDRFRAVALYTGAIALALVAATFAYLYFETSAALMRANEGDAVLTAPVATNGVAPDTGAAEALQEDPLQANLLELLQRAVNLGGRYPFGAVALDGERAELFRDFMQQLHVSGVRGTVVANVHVGKYCINLGADGQWLLPPSEQPLQECQQIGWPEPEAQSLGERQTLEFANVIALAQRDEQLAFQIVSHGSSEPAIPYPVFTEGLTAGEWNEIAARNQRVEVRVLPE